MPARSPDSHAHGRALAEADTADTPDIPDTTDDAAARRVWVHLVKAGRTKIRYPATLVADDGTCLVVRAPWAAEGVRDFGFVRFEPGDVFTEHYWRDRWYAVKEVRTGAGILKGWYCDVTRPAVVRGLGAGEFAHEVLVEDLDLDLWVSADGAQVLRLDEDEFARSGLADRDPVAAEAARLALDELELLVRDGTFTTLLALPS